MEIETSRRSKKFKIVIVKKNRTRKKNLAIVRMPRKGPDLHAQNRPIQGQKSVVKKKKDRREKKKKRKAHHEEIRSRTHTRSFTHSSFAVQETSERS